MHYPKPTSGTRPGLLRLVPDGFCQTFTSQAVLGADLDLGCDVMASWIASEDHHHVITFTRG
jgi:hypothetical protein